MTPCPDGDGGTWPWMRRRDRRPARRPPLQATVRLADDTSDYGRELAAALAAAFAPTCAWEWACTITVAMAGSPLIVLRFERHEPSAWANILDRYEYSWREHPDMPMDDLYR